MGLVRAKSIVRILCPVVMIKGPKICETGNKRMVRADWVDDEGLMGIVKHLSQSLINTSRASCFDNGHTSCISILWPLVHSTGM